MPWKCPICGVSNRDDRRYCDGCNYANCGILWLTSSVTGKRVPMRVDTVIGRSLLKSLGDEDCRYATDSQFKVSRDQALNGWAAEAASGARNPTYHNGVPLGAGPVSLKTGDVMSIGPEKMKMTVEIEAETPGSPAPKTA